MPKTMMKTRTKPGPLPPAAAAEADPPAAARLFKALADLQAMHCTPQPLPPGTAAESIRLTPTPAANARVLN